jgi:hypothetical protein
MTKTKLLLPALLACVLSYAQNTARYDVVITEIMADPSPAVGLPNAEFIEIKNISLVAIPLSGWKLADVTSTATITASVLLQPDSSIILCVNSNVNAFSGFGRTIGLTSFPSLDNDGDVLTLRSPQNKTIHSVAYTADWYENEAKKDGGWSLEMIDTKNPCTGKDNWKASTNNLGGTPGKTNSVNGTNNDSAPPQLKRAYTIDSVTVLLVFNESLDSSLAAIVANYSLPGFTIQSALVQAPAFQMVQLKLGTALQLGSVYTITAASLTDCKGNAIGAFNKAKLGLSQLSSANDIVVNEILFNPKPSAYDYVEFYNRSNKIIDVSKLYVANKSSNGTVSSLKKLAEEPFYLFPGDYAVVTEDVFSLNKLYLVKSPEAILRLSALPSFPDDKGNVVLLNLNGDMVDEVAYEDDWHFGLIDNDEGVALERIDPDGVTQKKDNWHSAASSAGYGTPGYRNSQYKKIDETKASVEVLPRIFSPDNDGRDDLATISYKTEENGYVANVLVFDAAGRIVRHLVKNDLLSLKGTWAWDGLGEKGNKLSIGTYIVLTEIFNLQGKKKSFKNTIVLARPMN